MKGRISIAPDFDAPLDQETLDLFEGTHTDDAGVWRGKADKT